MAFFTEKAVSSTNRPQTAPTRAWNSRRPKPKIIVTYGSMPGQPKGNVTTTETVPETKSHPGYQLLIVPEKATRPARGRTEAVST
jgi:hypothetical protein